MRHRVASKKLNRTSNHRKALFKNLAAGLIQHGEITTTDTKARLVHRMADKLITRAKKDSLHSRRLLHSFFNNSKVVTTLVDVLAPQLTQRSSGYTRVVKLGNRRGDNTPMAKVVFVDKVSLEPVKVEEVTKKPAKSKTVAK